jgi:hypothetical protein
MLHSVAGRVLGRVSLASACALIAVAASGCAGTGGWGYADEPGVPADILTTDGQRMAGSLVELSDEAVAFDTELERGENVEVRRRSGIDYVYVDGIVRGTAVEVRDFDIVVRSRVPLKRIDELHVRTRGYLGWGTAVAGVLAFFLVQVLEEQ